ncbi:PTS fructose transporter subunit IIC [Terrilactibacillus tamarindi]|nr:fructose-specific PTS transporter subunit EIIC [Terrilactibacillus tamarindi]
MKEQTNRKSIKQTLYDDLMSGIRSMIPFVAGGGILIAVSFLFGINATKPGSSEFNQFAKMLYDIGHEHAFLLMLPVFAGFIASAIAGKTALAPGMIGGLIAHSTGSSFFGGIIAGFLAGYSIRGLDILFKKFPSSLESLKNVLIFPVISTFFVGAIMFTVVAGPMSWLNSTLTSGLNSLGTSNLALVGAVLGLMMAVDLGGPVNKIAYTFGLAMIAQGNYYPMAAIMAAGLVPPLAVALSTTLFKSKFTIDERTQGKTYYLLGASFITESCMPVALADPLRIIPSVMIGSGITGALTMLFQIKLPAPHGGLFVIPVIDGGLMPKLLFLSTILIGTIVSAILIGLLKKAKQTEKAVAKDDLILKKA